jgi:phosphate transport system protein
MTRLGFDRQLRDLQHEILILGSMAAVATERAVDALKRRDAALAQNVIDHDTDLDQLAVSLEEQALLVIATQQPIATDLRTISAVLAITGELERIGDYAEGIAKVVLLSLDEPPIKPLIDIPRMADQSLSMLRRGLDAFIERDLTAARAIWEEDDEIDALHDQVYREMLTYMIEDPTKITRGTRLLWVTHNLERIADRVTNICERTIYMITGDRSRIVRAVPVAE